MFSLLRTKAGIVTVMGWFAAWLTLEMVFYGEPMFRYSSSSAGYASYMAELALVIIVTLLIAASVRPIGMVLRRAAVGSAPIAMGIIGSVCLFAVYAATSEAPLLPAGPLLVVGTAVYPIVSVALLCLLAQRTVAEVYEHGLREVLVLVLLGIALSFLLLPRFLRDTPYGILLVGLSPLAIGTALRILCRAWSAQEPITSTCTASASDEFVQSVGDVPASRATATLAALGILSILTYLISYFDFIVPAGFRVVVEENTYFYLAVFLLIGLLVATLAPSRSERALTSNLFVYILFGMMMLTLLVFFGVLSYVVSGGDYVYDLTKLLRRIVKIAMLFVLVVLVYQNSLDAARSFAGVMVAPLVIAKLMQMVIVSIPELQALVAANQYLYITGIGFFSIVAWTFVLVLCAQGNMSFSTHDGADESTGSDERLLDAGETHIDVPPSGARENGDASTRAVKDTSERYDLTEREADVLGYLAAGYSLKAISGALCVSQNTVKTHVTSIYRKTGVHSRQEIIELVNPVA